MGSGNPFGGLAEYDLRHLGQHLHDRGRAEDLHRLLSLETDAGAQAWFEAQMDCDGLATFVADVSLAWNLTLSPPWPHAPDGACQALYPLMLASLNSIAGRVPADLLAHLVNAGVWTFARAWAVARRVPDAEARTRSLGALAREASATEAGTRWEEALVALAEVAVEARRAALAAELGAGAPSPVVDRLESSARGLSDPAVRASGLAQLAGALVDHDRARALIDASDEAGRAIGSSMLRLDFVRRISSARLRVLGVRGAWEALSDTERAAALQVLAPALDATLVESACRLDLGVLPAHERDPARLQLGIRCAELGELHAAQQQANAIEDRRLRGRCLAAIIRARAGQGEIADAGALARQLPGAAQRIVGLLEVGRRASPQVGESMLAEARGLLKGLFNLREQATALQALASHLAERGDPQGALEAARAIELPEPRCACLVSLCRHCPDAASDLARIIERSDPASIDIDWAALPDPARRKLLECAVRRADAIGDLSEQVQAVAALRSVDADGARWALDTCGRIEDESDRSHALAALARCSPVSMLPGLDAAAQQLRDRTAKGRVLAVLLPRLVGSSADAEQAVQRALEIADPVFGSRALAELAATLPAAPATLLRRFALKLAAASSDTRDAARVFAILAPELEPADREALADLVLEQVRQIIARYEDGSDIEGASRAATVVASTASWLTVSQCRRYVDALSHLKDRDYRGRATVALVERAVSCGDPDAARGWCTSIEAPQERLRAAAVLATLLSGQLEEAEWARLAQQVEPSPPRSAVRQLLEMAGRSRSDTVRREMFERAWRLLDQGAPATIVDVGRAEDSELSALVLRLAAAWKALDLEGAAQAWRLAQHRLGQHSRRRALDLVGLAASAAGEALPTAAWVQALQRVSRWWP